MSEDLNKRFRGFPAELRLGRPCMAARQMYHTFGQ